MSGPAPVSVDASPLNQGVKLIITNPTIPSGYTFNGYNLYEPSIFPFGTPMGDQTTTYYHNPFDIVNGTTYNFSVSISWLDEFSNPIESAQTATTPTNITPAAGTPPTQILISILPKANPSNLEIWWDPPSSSGSTPLLQNLLEVYEDPGYTYLAQSSYIPLGNYFNLNEQWNGSPLTSNYNYIRIQAINENFDKGPFANYLFTQIGFFPSEPQTPTATRTSATSANVSWTAPASDGGAAIQYYVVNSQPLTAGVSTVKSLYATETTIEMTDLSSGVDYTFSIEAVNPPGYSPAAITAAIGP
jgi:hypothetical protein